MADRAFGDAPVESTIAAVVSAPDSTSILANITPAQLGVSTGPAARGVRTYQVTWLLGGSTNGNFLFGLTTASTGASSLGITQSASIAFSPPNQTAQYTMPYRISSGLHLRVQPNSTFSGNAFAKIVAEPLL